MCNVFLLVLVKSLCGLEASRVPAEEVLSVTWESCDSSDEMDAKESTNERTASRKKKSKRHKGMRLSLTWSALQGPGWDCLLHLPSY